MRTPIHLWIVGVMALLWNAGGAYDYIMTQTNNTDYLALLTEAQRAFLAGVPFWFEVAWAIGVWFSVAGAILLLLRSRFAGTAFAISLGGLIGSSAYSFFIAKPSTLDMMTAGQAGFTAMIYIVLILLWVYARAMTRRNVLT
ncbi:MAG: hypothetical protein AAFP98_09965 [Pseudomonadota bacterium]